MNNRNYLNKDELKFINKSIHGKVMNFLFSQVQEFYISLAVKLKNEKRSYGLGEDELGELFINMPELTLTISEKHENDFPF